jgi:hypothetical protein
VSFLPSPLNSRPFAIWSQSMSNISVGTSTPLLASRSPRWRWSGSQQPPPAHHPDPRSRLEALEELKAADLDWHWWEHGPWDCHSREEALAVIRERIGQRAIGELIEVTEVEPDCVLVVTRTRPESEIQPEDLGLEPGHLETAKRRQLPGRQGGRDAGLPDQGRGARGDPRGRAWCQVRSAT